MPWTFARCTLPALLLTLCLALSAAAADDKPLPPVSEATQACLDCHQTATPNIVANWKRSRMANITPAQAKQKEELARRVSFEKLPPELMNVAVGCAECHTQGGSQRGDAFSHDAYSVHTVVSSADCATCHPVEQDQYQKNLMANAWGNLTKNPLNMDMARRTNATLDLAAGKLIDGPVPDTAQAESCLHCHGTEVKVEGEYTIDDPNFGSMTFKKLSGWPNLGVGRINPDGSKGSCTACHPRHSFAIETARKPATCSECHKGPDVPVYKVYKVSKHGNLYDTQSEKWDFGAMPWVVGRHFDAPTCATCHVSLLTDPEGNVLAQRTHQMSDRIWQRLFGLPYSAAHPKEPDTSIIISADGLNKPTALDGTPATQFLIDADEQKTRQATMRGVCLGCHGSQWVDGQLNRLAETVEATNQLTLTSTKLLQHAWEKGLAKGPLQGGSLYDEAIERQWINTWLFYANSIRFSSAMVGADHGVFDDGRWQLTQSIYELAEKVGIPRRQPEEKQ